MLLEYGLRNFLSFKERTSVSFRLDTNAMSRTSPDRPATTVMCVKGENGSGKTHLLKALAFVASFATTSFSSEPDAEIPVTPFFSDRGPSSFFADFKVEETTYRYEIDVDAVGVVREALLKARDAKELVFERIQDGVEAVGRLKILERIRMRRNASVISTAYHHQIDELVPVHAFFRSIHSNVSANGSREAPFADIHEVAQFLSEHDDVRSYVEQFLKECDLGIKRLQIASEHRADGRRRFYPVFIHEVLGLECQVMPATASSGTMQLFRLMLPIAAMVTSGGVLVVDELYQHLHPHLLPKLLGLFQAADGPVAQLLFSTHCSDVMELCGHGRTTLVSKDNNQSCAYRPGEIGSIPDARPPAGPRTRSPRPPPCRASARHCAGRRP